MRPPSPQPSAARRTAKHKGGSTELPMTTKTPSCSKQRLKKGPWTPEEDELLSSCIAREGEGRWRTLPKRAGLLRCGKSCRLRWMNYLRPDVKRGHIAPDEEDLILRLHRLLGNRWSLIAGRIPGRTDNEIKNYWNTHLSKKLISQGIDPRTHKPLSTTTSFDHQQQQLPKTTLLSSSNHHNHIGTSSSAAAFEHEFCRIPPVPKVNWNYNWEESAAAENCNNSGSLNLQNCQVVPGFDGEKEEEYFNYTCTDEVFSSFLNSLINEDVLVFNDTVNGGNGASATPSTAALSDTNDNNNNNNNNNNIC